MEQMTMSRKERERLVVFNQIRLRQIGREEAAEVLGMSLRQLQRLYPRWLAEGDGGLVHRSGGRASSRRWDPAEKLKALELYRSTYRGFGPTLLAEKLGPSHGIWAGHDTVRRWLIEAGLLETTRRGRRSRRRRARMERFGQMLQMDGSPHAWFEDASGEPVTCVLMTIIDDATGRRRGRFFAAETLAAAMGTFGLWCDRFGVPEKLYVDRHGIYRADRDPTPEELKAGKRPVTQFGRAMKELKLAKITSIEQANAWLQTSGFWDTLDAKFGVDPLDEADAHRPLVVNLADVLCVKEKRSVGADGCVQWSGRVPQLTDPGKLRQVQVWERPDGSLCVLGAASTPPDAGLRKAG